MKEISIYISILFTFFASVAQNNDSLLKIIKNKQTSDTTYISTLITYAKAIDNIDTSIYYLHIAIEKSLEIGFQKYLPKAKNALALNYRTKGDNKAALMHYYEGLSYAKSLKDYANEAAIYSGIGIVMKFSGLYDSSLHYYYTAGDIYKRTNDSIGIVTILINTANVYREMGNYRKSLENNFLAINIAEKINDFISLAILYNNIGNIYFYQKKYDKALEYYFSSIKIKEKMNNKRGILFSLNNIGACYKEKGELEKALFYQKKNLQSATELGLIFNQAVACSELADVYLLLGDNFNAEKIIKKGLKYTVDGHLTEEETSLKTKYARFFNATKQHQQAYIYASEALKMAESIKNIHESSYAAKAKSIAAYNLGKYKEAYESQSTYFKYNDSIINENNLQDALYKDFEYQSEKMKLEEEKRFLKYQSEVEKQKLILNGFIIGFLFMITLVFVIFRLYRIKRKSNILLSLQNIEITKQKEKISTQALQLEKINENLEHKIEEEVLKNREKDIMISLQSRHAEMGEMIENIAHQWRQPLSSLSILIQNINEAHKYNELSIEYLEKKTEKSVGLIKFMSQTIDDFRNFFKPEKEAVSFDVNYYISKALLFFEIGIKNISIKIETKYTENIKAFGFPNEFIQVLLVVLNNAKDAIIERKINDPIIIINSAQISSNQIEIKVSDNAGGIDKEILNKIFNIYFTTKDKSTGTGIGLYLAKNIIEKNMNGKITAYNIDKGLEFKIVLNCNKP